MARRYAAVCILAFATIASMPSHPWVDDVGPSERVAMDQLCRGFSGWQSAAAEMGATSDYYTGTGMERFCPSMI